ncbi:MAG: hypothetical protein A2X22_08435 [Bacteroidetes bacterium GWF2_49_14]|nr:MAG: hypothetical protein A2X22_08435 [Bacteroidetes bacterium GWF2_49_14]HBB92299.1 hypothetical protein [Bacteroidales bacterium]
MTDAIEELEQKVKELKEKNELFPSYLSGLSHDIRTPLNSIIGFADLLKEQPVTKAEQRLYSKMVARSSRKLLDLMSNLIDLARIETGNLVIYDQRVILADLLEELTSEMDEMKGLYDKESIQTVYTISPDVPAEFRSDRNRVYQVVRILQENSLKFTSIGRITLEVGAPTKKTLSFRIIDTGCGMSQATIDGLFELFPPADVLNGKKIKSRGLSLLVVKKLCELLKGTIKIISEPGKGTAVTVTLPV